jgi:hypothetical protein
LPENGTIGVQEGEKAMAKNQTHYLPNGKEYSGQTHKAGNVLMTGAKHTPSSKVLTHTSPKKTTNGKRPKAK